MTPSGSRGKVSAMVDDDSMSHTEQPGLLAFNQPQRMQRVGRETYRMTPSHGLYIE